MHVTNAELLSMAGGSPAQAQAGPTAIVRLYFDVCEQHSPRPACTQRFHQRLFGGKTNCQPLSRPVMLRAPLLLSGREDSIQEMLAISVQQASDPGHSDYIGTYTNYHITGSLCYRSNYNRKYTCLSARLATGD